MIEFSDSESRRFGHRVGRTTISRFGDVSEVLSELDAYDVVVARTQADDWRVPVALSSQTSHLFFTADHLMVWQGDLRTASRRSLPAGWLMGEPRSIDEVIDVVRDSFDGYRSHYSMNRLFETGAVLDGYCEWAAVMASRDDHECIVLADDANAPVGVALVDFSPDVPDVRLAGMIKRAQGRGLYASLLAGVAEMALGRGATELQISTQSTNVNVMRAWARLGLLPTSTIATHHLTRLALLPDWAGGAADHLAQREGAAMTPRPPRGYTEL